MNEEIKEILDRLKDSVTSPIVNVPVMCGVSELIDNSQCLEPNECKILLDYITNLQEELKNRPIVDFTFDVYKELEDYKQRIDKANQIIMKQKTKMYKSRNKIAMYILMKLEKVLNGSDEE